MITRKKVKAKAFQKKELCARVKSLNKTVCGKGRISGAAIIAATAYHSIIRKKGEIILQRFSFFSNQLLILFIIKALIRQLSANGSFIIFQEKF